MEQFKKLKWSFEKYEEEKTQDPRVFDFSTISDRDPLTRTLNEVHLCTLPKEEEYRLFKTPQEIAANTFDNRGLVDEVKDPRNDVTRLLKSAEEQIKDYGYSSELTQQEQNCISQSLHNEIQHNPRIIKLEHKLQSINSSSPLPSPELIEKWKKEIAHFNKCAEIYYHRHITDLNNLISNDIKSFLLKRWNLLEYDLTEWKYQVITMLLRQKTWTKTAEMYVEFDCEDAQEFSKEFYIVPQNFFPPLHGYSIERLKHYEQQRKDIEDVSEAEIKISLDVLAKLFSDGNEFSIAFENCEEGTKFSSSEVVPSKLVNPVEALEEAVKKIFASSVEWLNINEHIDNNFERKEDFQAQTINDFMTNIYTKYKSRGGQNVSTSVWKIKRNQQEITLGILRDVLCLDNDTTANISFKFEFQTKFGAEKMTKEELLREWIVSKFSINSKMLRYRVDARTLQILSISQILIEDIEKDLKETYEFDPLNALEVLYNAFNSIKNLPLGNYLIQAKIGTLHIYKSTEQGKQIISNEDIKISSTFARKWIPIDERILTYIQVNCKMAPCCFPISFGRHKKSTSYTLPVKKFIKVTTPTAPKVMVKKNKKKKGGKAKRLQNLRKNLRPKKNK